MVLRGCADAGAVVLHLNEHAVFLLFCAESDDAFGPIPLFRRVADGVCGVDDQVELDLVHFGDAERDRRQVGIKFGDHLGHVFPFVARNRNGGQYRLVQVGGVLGGCIWVRKFLEGFDDATRRSTCQRI
jgi:hypothetical protein